MRKRKLFSLIGERLKKAEFSKMSLILHYLVSAVLIAVVIVGTLTGYDVTNVAMLAGASVLVDGYDTKHYFWKARNENRAKYAQQFVKDLAQAYGIDAAIRVADTVLKE